MVLSDQTVGKEYQIPELVDLNGVGEAIGEAPSGQSGSAARGWGCGTGTIGGPSIIAFFNRIFLLKLKYNKLPT